MTSTIREKSACLAYIILICLLVAAPAFAAERPALRVFSANDLLGAEVIDNLGHVGEIADVFYDPEQGVISSVVVGFGRGPDGYEGYSVVPLDGIRFDGVRAFMLDARDWNVRSFDARPNGSRSLLRTLGVIAVDTRSRPIGRIRSVMVDVNSGVIAYVIVSLEGIGYPDMIAAMPWQALQLLPSYKTVQLLFDPDLVYKNAYRNDADVNYSDPAFASKIYQAYNTPRFWSDNEKRGVAGEGEEPAEKDVDTKNEDAMKEDGAKTEQQPKTGDADEEAQSAWNPGSDFNAKFDPQNVRVYEGVIEGVEMFRPDAVSVRGVRFRLRGSRGQSVMVYTAPVGYTQRLGLLWRYGTEVRVHGTPANISGRDVVIAQSVDIDGLTVKFRDEKGLPLWQARDLVAAGPREQLTMPVERETARDSRGQGLYIQPLRPIYPVYGGGTYNQYGRRISPSHSGYAYGYRRYYGYGGYPSYGYSRTYDDFGFPMFYPGIYSGSSYYRGGYYTPYYGRRYYGGRYYGGARRYHNVYGGGLYNRYGRRIHNRSYILLDKKGIDVVWY